METIKLVITIEVSVKAENANELAGNLYTALDDAARAMTKEESREPGVQMAVTASLASKMVN